MGDMTRATNYLALPRKPTSGQFSFSYSRSYHNAASGLDLSVVPWYEYCMSVEKFTISFASELFERVRTVADGNVSGWLADAASRKLRHLEALELLREYEAEHGEVSQEELAEVRKEWPG